MWAVKNIRYGCVKNPGTQKLFPSVKSSSGTGFFVSYRNCTYLVTTAKHVATKLQLESEMVIGGDSLAPIHVKISDLVKDSVINWTYNENADVAVLAQASYDAGVSPKTWY
jgi:hypothetical protein